MKKWYLSVLSTEYANFAGRMRRRDFWMFKLFDFLVVLALGFIVKIIFSILGISVDSNIIYLIYYLVTFLPHLAITVRRLHDTTRSGWWVLLNLIPLFGSIVLLIFFCQNSTPGNNIYGTNPKGEDDD